MDNADRAAKIVGAILDDLTGRRGFDGAWDNIAVDIRDEICLKLVGIVAGHLPAELPERHPMEAPVLATVDLVDVGQHAIALYGRETAEAILRPGAPFREHDYRFEIHMATGARCSFGSDATAEYVASWLRREGVLS